MSDLYWKIFQWFLISLQVRPRDLPMTHKMVIPLVSSFFPFLFASSCSGILSFMLFLQDVSDAFVVVPSAWKAPLPGICRICSSSSPSLYSVGTILEHLPLIPLKLFLPPQSLPPLFSHIFYPFFYFSFFFQYFYHIGHFTHTHMLYTFICSCVYIHRYWLILFIYLSYSP